MCARLAQHRRGDVVTWTIHLGSDGSRLAWTSNARNVHGTSTVSLLTHMRVDDASNAHARFHACFSTTSFLEPHALAVGAWWADVEPFLGDRPSTMHRIARSSNAS